jgi:hypothetical protein
VHASRVACLLRLVDDRAGDLLGARRIGKDQILAALRRRAVRVAVHAHCLEVVGAVATVDVAHVVIALVERLADEVVERDGDREHLVHLPTFVDGGRVKPQRHVEAVVAVFEGQRLDERRWAREPLQPA